jgi:hypothetical protein
VRALIIFVVLAATVALLPAAASPRPDVVRAFNPAHYTLAHGHLVALDRSGGSRQVAGIAVVCDRALVRVGGVRVAYRGTFCAGDRIDRALNTARRI